MPTPADAFAEHCVELLAPLGAARARRMFGGHGLYLDGLMVGLIAGEQLYLKVDAETLPRWQAEGGKPFVYTSTRDGASRTATMSYWTPPAEAFDSPGLMQPWARLALEAALRAQASRRARPPRRSAAKAQAPTARVAAPTARAASRKPR